ncbi:reverse transcriptase [Phytophthora megakarya]|uniref:Reverse transcriptase n=1 Tax=Phytophthora megakarya TaxID=4795 RepID=A0A225WSN1_9STRA|nr:reverse transcriptase [Phytophthora megakarya]OWZ20643.1 reverse transcriptase [Phytophthora megakarya]
MEVPNPNSGSHDTLRIRLDPDMRPHDEDCKTGSTSNPDVQVSDPEPERFKTPFKSQDPAPDPSKETCHHDGGAVHAEDYDGDLAVLPEVTATTAEVRIQDLHVGDPEANPPEEIQRLVDIIWDQRHLLIGKGNALPTATVGAVCDIDVGDAKPIAQRVRKVAPQYREKSSDLIKGLISARSIQVSTSPWASPIVAIIKKNGVDIRVCINYGLVNYLTRLMVYPMPLINDLLEGLDAVLCGLWVVSMTDRARAIFAFITPFGLF